MSRSKSRDSITVFHLVLLLVSFFTLALFLVRAISPASDTYWDLAIGRIVVNTGQIPKLDTFVYSAQDKNFTSVEWLAGAILYMFTNIFGMDGVIILRVIIGLLIAYLLYKTLSLVSKNTILKLSLVFIAIFVIAIRFFDRPENFSYLIVAFINYIFLHSYVKNKVHNLVVFLPIIFLAWPNIHGFAPFGVILLCFYNFIFLLQANFKPSKSLYFCFAVCAISILLSVLQYERFFNFLVYIKDPALPAEYMSLKERLMLSGGVDFLGQISWYIYIYFIFLIVNIWMIFLTIKNKKSEKITTFTLLFCLIFLSLGIFLFRTIPHVILLTLPLLFLFSPRHIFHKLKFLNQPILIVLFLILLYSAYTERIVGSKENIQIYKKRGDIIILNNFWHPQFPTQAPFILNKYLDSKRVFTNVAWSNYLVWYSPQVQVFDDKLWDLVSRKHIGDKLVLASGREGWQQLLEKYDIDTVINSPSFDFHLFTSTPVYRLKNWQLVYIDDSAVIYAREDVIKSVPVELSAINPNSPLQLKIKPLLEKKGVQELNELLRFDTMNGFAREQLIIYYMSNDINKAIQLAEESNALLPKNPMFSAYLSVILASQGKCTLAFKYMREAELRSYNHPVVTSILEPVIKRCSGKRVKT